VKFGHVTFVWNGNRSGQFSETLEEYVEIPSDQGISFNLKPEMKAMAIAEKACEALHSGKWDQVSHSPFHRTNIGDIPKCLFRCVILELFSTEQYDCYIKDIPHQTP
jgi:hypothetical protein